MVMKKKAQAAMEFLMTYGWAILVVLVVIGALAYFGVLNPQNLLPEKCTLPVGLNCKDFIINSGSPGEIILNIENGMGEGIIIRSINVSGSLFSCNDDDQTGVGNYNGISGWHLANGYGDIVTIKCDGALDPFTGKTKGNIIITYCSDTVGGADGPAREANCIKFTHTIEGELMARVE